MNKLQEAIDSLDKVIELEKKKIVLYGELRQALAIALRAGVDPNDIARSGYDPSKDKRYQKWPNCLQDEIRPEPNYVILKDGSRVDFEIDWETRLNEYKEKRKKLFARM